MVFVAQFTRTQRVQIGHDGLNLIEIGLLSQLSKLGESVGQIKRLVAQEVENIAEERTVAIDEYFLLRVSGRGHGSTYESSEHRIRTAFECGSRGCIVMTADIQLDNLIRISRSHSVCLFVCFFYIK